MRLILHFPETINKLIMSIVTIIIAYNPNKIKIYFEIFQNIKFEIYLHKIMVLLYYTSCYYEY